MVNFGSAPFATTGFLGTKGVCAVVAVGFSCTGSQPLQDVVPTFTSRTVQVCGEYDLVCDTGTVVDNFPINTQSGRSVLINMAKSTHVTYRKAAATKTAGMFLGRKIAD